MEISLLVTVFLIVALVWLASVIVLVALVFHYRRLWKIAEKAQNDAVFLLQSRSFEL